MWLLPLLACASHRLTPTPEAAFRFAVGDAAIAEPREVRADLIALTPTGGAEWVGASGRVRMVTWTTWPGYTAAVGQELVLAQEVWATPAPQLQRACAAMPPDRREARMVQLLGLRPNSARPHVVVLHVDPAQAFRPCPDPEVTDTTCGLRFPEGVDPAHRAWFNQKQAESYRGEGYPWTRLGYTYDWGGEGEVGLSEFVLRLGSTVRVEAVSTVEAYCAAP